MRVGTRGDSGSSTPRNIRAWSVPLAGCPHAPSLRPAGARTVRSARGDWHAPRPHQTTRCWPALSSHRSHTARARSQPAAPPPAHRATPQDDPSRRASARRRRHAQRTRNAYVPPVALLLVLIAHVLHPHVRGDHTCVVCSPINPIDLRYTLFFMFVRARRRDVLRRRRGKDDLAPVLEAPPREVAPVVADVELRVRVARHAQPQPCAGVRGARQLERLRELEAQRARGHRRERAHALRLGCRGRRGGRGRRGAQVCGNVWMHGRRCAEVVRLWGRGGRSGARTEETVAEGVLFCCRRGGRRVLHCMFCAKYNAGAVAQAEA